MKKLTFLALQLMFYPCFCRAADPQMPEWAAILSPADQESLKTPLMQLQMAAERGDCDAIRALLDDTDNDLTVDSAGYSEITALMLAAKEGHAKAVDALHKMGADINATSKAHFTALHYAAQCGDEDVVGTLLGFGADKTIENVCGETAADVAEQKGNSALAQRIRAWSAEGASGAPKAARG